MNKNNSEKKKKKKKRRKIQRGVFHPFSTNILDVVISR